MKKEWMEPVVEVQEFAANEYVAYAGIVGKFINLSAMLDNTVIIIMFIIMMDLGKKNISQKRRLMGRLGLSSSIFWISSL